MKAMILAAGLGTRLKPFTDKHPKALAVVNGKTLLEHNINYLKNIGVNDIVINVHHFASQIIEYLKNNNYFNINIAVSDETDAVLETGGGVLNARHLLQNTDNFIVMNVDILTDLDLQKVIHFHESKKALATLCVSERTSSRQLLFDEKNILCGWQNNNTQETKISRLHDDLTPYAFSGIQILNHSIFKHISFAGKFSLIDLYLDLAKQFELYAYIHNHILLDVGKPESIAQAEKLFP